MKAEYITHTFEPVFDSRSRVLLLGTMPSPQSRRQGFYYGHPRNRFWPVIADICAEPCPQDIEGKIRLCLDHGIALWDVLAGCEIRGASDSSIRDPRPNDMGRILNCADIRAVFTTGTKAYQLYQKYCYPETGIAAKKLPSTSPANCGVSYEELRRAYAAILPYLPSA